MTEKDISDIIHKKYDNAIGFDPFTILTIISIAISVYKIIQNCRASKALIKASAKRKGLSYRIFVKKHLQDELIKAGVSPEKAEEIIEDLRLRFVQDAA